MLTESDAIFRPSRVISRKCCSRFAKQRKAKIQDDSNSQDDTVLLSFAEFSQPILIAIFNVRCTYLTQLSVAESVWLS